MSVTVHELVVPLMDESVQVLPGAVKVSVEFVENDTVPAGDDLVPSASVSLTKAVAVVPWSTLSGFMLKVIDVMVVLLMTVRLLEPELLLCLLLLVV